MPLDGAKLGFDCIRNTVFFFFSFFNYHRKRGTELEFDHFLLLPNVLAEPMLYMHSLHFSPMMIIRPISLSQS
jgi:hypothetical protein